MSLVRLGLLNFAFAGGGYFRLLPYPLIARWTRQQPGTMTYFHPRDFDADQPLIPGLSAIRRFKAYVGLKGAVAKLERFLDAFGGVTLQEAGVSIQWERTPQVSFRYR